MTASPRNAPPIWIILVALLSGGVCLVYELVWSRYLHLILGVSAYALAMVLASFMLGLALGAWHVGRLIDQAQKPARMLLILEAAIGIYIGISPAIYHLIAAIDGRIVQTILAILSLLLPTYLMGGTFPAFVRLATRDIGHVGTDAGLIYAVNTLGGAIGAFVTGFFLIGTLGLSKTLFLAALISMGIVCMLAVVLRRSQSPATSAAPKKPKGAKPAAKDPFTLIAAVFGICGFTGLAYEVYWTRLLSLFFKDSIYDLTIVLTTYLTGLAVGSLACAGLLRRVKRPRDMLALVLVLIGFAAFTGLYLVDRFPYWINDLQTNSAMVERYGGHFWLAGNAIRFWYALLLMFIPTCLFGAVLPLVSRIAVHEIDLVGRKIGLLSGINTLGSALGALAAGFVFIGALGLAKSITLMAFLDIAAALLLVRSWFVRGLTVCIAVLVAALVPRWDPLRMSLSFLDPNQNLEMLIAQDYYREDVHGITSVLTLKPLSRKYMVTNRLFTQNSSEMLGLEDHRRLGALPMLLHPAPNRVLAVGLGAGITLRGIADQSADSIDCVEISPTVVEAARYFGEENAQALDRPNVHMIIDDARHFMRTGTGQYDVIVLDIFHPMSGGSSMIFSREYYEACRARLAPKGLICQWLPAHQLSMDEIKTVAATMQAVFPHLSLWYGLIGESTAVVGLIGSAQPLSIDYQRLASACAAHPELGEINLNTPELILSQFIVSDNPLRAFCAGAQIDSDDLPVVELSAPRIATQANRLGMENLVALASQMGNVRQYVSSMPERSDLDRTIAAKKTLIEGLDMVLHGNARGRAPLYQAALDADPGNPDLQYALQQLSVDP